MASTCAAVASDDDDDYVFRTSNVSRLEREVSRAKPGDELDLRVYFNGQYRNVKVKAARYSDLPRRKSTLTIMGGDNFTIPSLGRHGLRREQRPGRRSRSDARSRCGGSRDGVGRSDGSAGEWIGSSWTLGARLEAQLDTSLSA